MGIGRGGLRRLSPTSRLSVPPRGLQVLPMKCRILAAFGTLWESPYHSAMLYLFPVAAVTSHHQLSVFKQQESIQLQFWWPEWIQGLINRTTRPAEALGQMLFLASFSSWWLLAFRGLWCSSPIYAFISARPSWCLSDLSWVSHWSPSR